MPSGTGSLVISLDFELRWGTRDRPSPASARQLLNAREVVRRLLDLFASKNVSASWCTVGMLFAEDRDELRHYLPEILPSYGRDELNPYREQVGAGEADDPLHYAPSLIRAVQSCPGQEIGSHTFSHYYCLEPGQTSRQFEADLSSALCIVKARGVELRSLVFPRNQVDPALFPILASRGITSFRGTSRSWVHSAADFATQRQVHRRGLRLVDSYLPLLGDDNAGHPREVFPGLYELTASRYFRPFRGGPATLARLAADRIVQGMAAAARKGDVYHLWFHPEDFGCYPTENLHLLSAVLEKFSALRDKHGMQSRSMSELCCIPSTVEISEAA